MTVEAVSEIVGVAASLFGLAWLVRHGQRRLSRATRFILLALLATLGVVHGADLGQALGVSLLDRLGEHLRFLVPMLWLMCVFALSRDATLRRLRVREEQLRLLVAQTPVAMAVFDQRFVCLACTARWLEAYARPGHGGTGSKLADFGDEARRFWEPLVRRCLKEGGPHSAQRPEQLPLAHGAEWVRWTAEPWFQHDGGKGGVILLFEVVTRQLEEEARTQRLQDELSHAQRVDSVGELAGGVVHDLRNVLQVITAYIDMLDEGDVTAADIAESREVLTEAAKSAEGLCSTLLELGQPQRAPEPLELGQLVREIALLCERTLGRARRPGFDVWLQLEPKQSWIVLGDRTQLSQVLLNLAVNARDAMPDGGTLRFEVATALRDAEVRGVVIRVSDDGVGMSPEVSAQVFDRFFTTKAPDEGSGFGLATARRIVEGHRGRISVESVVSRGTTFTIWLPTLLAKPAAAGLPPLGSNG